MSPPGRPKGENRSAQHEGIPVTALLETRSLIKRFGGLTATDNVSLTLLPGPPIPTRPLLLKTNVLDAA